MQPTFDDRRAENPEAASFAQLQQSAGVVNFGVGQNTAGDRCAAASFFRRPQKLAAPIWDRTSADAFNRNHESPSADTATDD